MDSQIQNTFCVYKIYSEHCLLYIGSTKKPLQEALHAHFFKAPEIRPINLGCVTRIEYAVFPTEADMIVMETYYVNQLKPALNQIKKAADPLTIGLPEIAFQDYRLPQIEKWKKEIHASFLKDTSKCRLYMQIEKERQEKECEIFAYPNMDLEEKQMAYEEWLRNFYEPVRNGLL